MALAPQAEPVNTGRVEESRLVSIVVQHRWGATTSGLDKNSNQGIGFIHHPRTLCPSKTKRQQQIERSLKKYRRVEKQLPHRVGTERCSALPTTRSPDLDLTRSLGAAAALMHASRTRLNNRPRQKEVAQIAGTRIPSEWKVEV